MARLLKPCPSGTGYSHRAKQAAEKVELDGRLGRPGGMRRTMTKPNPRSTRVFTDGTYSICLVRAGRGFGLLLPSRLCATAARIRSFNAASSSLSSSWMSMARLTFPSRLELNRPEGSFNAAPLAKVILTTSLYVSPVQMIPAWDQMGVPLHFHSSTISGSAWCTILRTFASVFPRQSPSCLIFSSMNADADSTGLAFL
jgi:hypothetical protein